jgi:polyphosphate kinase 2 (PPK2 family)
VELVRMQDWIKATGTKICVVFEGRDGAGQRRHIKALTEREPAHLSRDRPARADRA